MIQTLVKTHCQHWSCGGVDDGNPFHSLTAERHVHLYLNAEVDAMFGLYTVESGTFGGESQPWNISNGIFVPSIIQAKNMFFTAVKMLNDSRTSSVNVHNLEWCKTQEYLQLLNATIDLQMAIQAYRL